MQLRPATVTDSQSTPTDVNSHSRRLLMSVNEGPPIPKSEDILYPISHSSLSQRLSGHVATRLKVANDVRLRCRVTVRCQITYSVSELSCGIRIRQERTIT